MKSLFKKIKSKFSNAFRWLLRIEEPEVQDRILDTVDAINDLMVFAVPSIQMVAALTPTPVDDAVVAALALIGREAKEILDLPKRERRNALLDLGVEVTYIHLREAIASAARSGVVVRIGSVAVTLETLADFVSDSMLRAAVDYAYAVIFKNRV